MADKPTTKKYAKGERSIPHPSQKASKYYPAEDVAAPKQVRRVDDNSTATRATNARKSFKLCAEARATDKHPQKTFVASHLQIGSSANLESRLANPSARLRFARPSLLAPSSSSSLVASAASASSSSSTSSRACSSSPVRSKSMVFPCEG